MTRKAKPSKWVSIAEAVDRIRKVKGCTREEAMEILAMSAQTGKLNMRKRLIEPDPVVPAGEQAARAFAEKSENAYMPLGYFVRTFGFDPADILAELRSGRLRAVTTADGIFRQKLGEKMDADYFQLTAGAIHEWVSNPETPGHLLVQMNQAMQEMKNR